MFNINENIINIGVKDLKSDLFEGQYTIKNGIMYNSYIVLDEETTIFDTVDNKFTQEWLNNIRSVLQNKKPSYLVIHHIEPDHSGSIADFIKEYPQTKIVTNSKSFAMINQFFKLDNEIEKIIVKDGDILSTGKHIFKFIFAPMVHWPEVMITYDETSKILFSADAFGTFGIYDEKDGFTSEEWAQEASRYYIGIVGKYGVQVQSLLKKVSGFNVEKICSLHGPVLNRDLGEYINLYNIWSSYEKEKDGVVIAYSSAYGNTKKAVELLDISLKEKGVKTILIYDLARCDLSKAVADAFRYEKIVFASITYNAGLFPMMHNFINALVSRNFQNKDIGIIENGSWAPMAKKTILSMLEKCKNLNFTQNNVTINSALDEKSTQEILFLADELSK